MAGYKGGGGAEIMSCTCIFLESNKYFLGDVFGATTPEQQLRYLLGLATAARATPSAEVNRELYSKAHKAAQNWPEGGRGPWFVEAGDSEPLCSGKGQRRCLAVRSFCTVCTV